MFEDTKGVIRIRKSKKDKQHNGQKKKDKQHNGQKKKDKQHNDQKKKDKQNNGQKKKDKQHNGQKKKNQKDKERSTKRTHQTKDTALQIRYYCSLKNKKFVVGTQFLIQLYVQSIEQIRYHVKQSHYSMIKLSIKTILQHFE